MGCQITGAASFKKIIPSEIKMSKFKRWQVCQLAWELHDNENKDIYQVEEAEQIIQQAMSKFSKGERPVMISNKLSSKPISTNMSTSSHVSRSLEVNKKNSEMKNNEVKIYTDMHRKKLRKINMGCQITGAASFKKIIPPEIKMSKFKTWQVCQLAWELYDNDKKDDLQVEEAVQIIQQAMSKFAKGE